MTNKQKRTLKRNQEIRKLFRTMTIEDLAEKYQISIPSVYRILKQK